MKRLAFLISILSLVDSCLFVASADSGYFNFSNLGAPTRLGNGNGPLGGTNIFAQALVGPNASSLAPLGFPVSHFFRGIASAGVLEVPNVMQPDDTVYVQLAAWDTTLWGANYSNVPRNQIGFTDIVAVGLYFKHGPFTRPVFTMPAIVPVVPEPSVWALATAGGAAALWFTSRQGSS